MLCQFKLFSMFNWRKGNHKLQSSLEDFQKLDSVCKSHSLFGLVLNS